MLEDKGNNKETTAKVERLCLFPTKLLYRLRTLRPVYERELIKSELAEAQQAEKAGEISKILKPIDALLKTKADNVDLLSALQARGFQISAVVTEKSDIIIRSENKIDCELLAAELSKILNRSYCWKNSEFSYLDKCHLFTFTQGAKYAVKVEIGRHAYGKISGDVAKTINRDGIFHALLSDGMGHGDDSYKISTYLSDVFQTVSELGLSPEEAIDETNRLVKLKSGEEDYATLDYLRIDLANLNAVLYKFGTYVSYLYRNKVLYEYDRVFLPLGIVDEPDISPTMFTLKEGDVFLLASDGLNKLTYQDITSCFKAATELSGIKDTLLKMALAKADDDITVILLKIASK